MGLLRREDRASALQREVEELRQSRARALQEADEHREALRERQRELAQLGVELPPVDKKTEWKPPTDLPEIPEGWMTGPPDFVGVGAQRAGTTWWFRMIAAHPEIHPPLKPGRKELHYLSGFPSGVMTEEQVQGYYARLPRPPGHVAGEWTPGYMAEHWVPRLLARVAPDAKLLVLLRDPVDRYRSAVSFPSRRPTGRTDGAEAAEQGPARQVYRNQAYRGFYCAQLRALLQHFPREQLLVQQHERCRAEPEAELRRAWAFLGVDPDAAELPEFSEQVGQKVSRAELSPELREDLIAFWADDLAALGREFPEVDLALWPSEGELPATD